jgi:hypothetical protein
VKLIVKVVAYDWSPREDPKAFRYGSLATPNNRLLIITLDVEHPIRTCGVSKHGERDSQFRIVGSIDLCKSLDSKGRSTGGKLMALIKHGNDTSFVGDAILGSNTNTIGLLCLVNEWCGGDLVPCAKVPRKINFLVFRSDMRKSAEEREEEASTHLLV